MNKNMICIECPKGCSLSVDIENCKVIKVAGAKCPRGVKYAISEIDNPTRILTATVLTKGLSIKLVPVRTDKPIPKKDLLKAMEVIKNFRLEKSVRQGDVIITGLLDTGANVIATRTVE